MFKNNQLLLSAAICSLLSACGGESSKEPALHERFYNEELVEYKSDTCISFDQAKEKGLKIDGLELLGSCIHETSDNKHLIIEVAKSQKFLITFSHDAYLKSIAEYYIDSHQDEAAFIDRLAQEFTVVHKKEMTDDQLVSLKNSLDQADAEAVKEIVKNLSLWSLYGIHPKVIIEDKNLMHHATSVDLREGLYLMALIDSVGVFPMKITTYEHGVVNKEYKELENKKHLTKEEKRAARRA